jgi:flagellar hook protein FlgE
MLRSLFSSVAGLRSHQTMMDVTGNNIANVNTTGFKSTRVTFGETLAQTIQGGGVPTTDSGGTNPAQLGLGVRVASIDANYQQGAFQSTGRLTDLAVQGSGFFLLDRGGEQLLTRSGSFSWDSTGTLVSPDGGRVLGWGPSATGQIVATGAPSAITIPTGTLPPTPTTSVTVGGNLTSSLAVGESLSTTATAYDSLGAPFDIALTFTRTGTGTWDVVASYDDNGTPTTLTGAPPPTITFDAAGVLTGPANITLAGITLGDGDPQDLTINFGDADHAISQFDRTSTIDVPMRNGGAGAELVGVTFGTNGAVIGRYSNGETRDLAVVALANVTNPSGLQRVGDNMFAVSPSSGAPTFGQPGQGELGTLAPGTLEGSNVDLAAEFTNLVIAQRGFQANSRVITTSDEMLADLVNLKR